MTTTAQVKKLVTPLVQHHADLALVGRTIVIRPVHHILRFISLSRTSNPDQLTTGWNVNILFQPARVTTLSWGDGFYAKAHGRWLLSNPRTQAVLFEEIEKKALPPLRAMDTIENFLAHVSGHDYRHHLFDRPCRKFIVDIALGDFDSARAICANTICKWNRKNFGQDEEDWALLDGLKKLCVCLAADDRKGMAKILHDWEAQTVKNLKVDHLWEPTPFPFEVRGRQI